MPNYPAIGETKRGDNGVDTTYHVILEMLADAWKLGFQWYTRCIEYVLWPNAAMKQNLRAAQRATCDNDFPSHTDDHQLVIG